MEDAAALTSHHKSVADPVIAKNGTDPLRWVLAKDSATLEGHQIFGGKQKAISRI
jgi:hypothetical protein